MATTRFLQRLTGLIFALAILGGCSTLSDTHVKYLQSKCAIYGLEPGTDAHAVCYNKEALQWQRKTWGDSFG